MKINKFLGIFLILTLFLSLVSSQIYALGTVSSVNVKFTEIRQIPDPVEPGKTFDILMQLDNLYQEPITGVKVIFNNQYPFTIDPSDTPIREFVSIEKGGSVSFRFKIKVDERAVQGENKLKFVYMSNRDGAGLESQEIVINIQSVSSALGISSVTVTPTQIVPGGDGKITVTLKNDAPSLIKDLSLKLDLGSSAVPLAPSQSTSEKRLNQILRGESVDVVFDVVALPDADSGIYKVPITLTYFDELGKQYNKTDIVGVIVGGIPDLVVQVDKSSVYTTKEQGEVTLKFVNKGLVNVKFLNLKIMPSADFKLLSNPEFYIGKVDSDDFESVDLKLVPKRYVDGKLSIPIVIDYTDATNKPYHQELVVPVTILSKEEAGVQSGSGILGIIITLVILVFLVVEFRSFRKKAPQWPVFYYPLYLVKVIFGPIVRLFKRKPHHKK